MKYHVVVCLLVALLTRHVWRDRVIRERHSEAVGWCQLAVADASAGQCQCADGNVVKFGPRAYAVAGFVNATSLRKVVTADDKAHHLYQHVNATIRLPGEVSYTTIDMVGKEAYCIQICFHGFYSGITLDLIRDSLLLDLKLF